MIIAKRAEKSPVSIIILQLLPAPATVVQEEDAALIRVCATATNCFHKMSNVRFGFRRVDGCRASIIAN
jgi:hypothetical protein